MLGGVSFSAGKRFGLGPAVTIFGERIGGDRDLGVRRGEGAEKEERAVLVAADEIERFADEQVLRIQGAAAGGVFGDFDALTVFPKVVGVVGVGLKLNRYRYNSTRRCRDPRRRRVPLLAPSFS